MCAFGYVNGAFVINPKEEERAVSELNLTVAGSYDAVMMVEAGANELSEEIVLDAILFGHAEIRRLVEFQKNIQSACGKEKQIPAIFAVSEELEEKIRVYAEERLDAATRNEDKLGRDADIAAIKSETMEHFIVEYPGAGKRDFANSLQD